MAPAGGAAPLRCSGSAPCVSQTRRPMLSAVPRAQLALLAALSVAQDTGPYVVLIEIKQSAANMWDSLELASL